MVMRTLYASHTYMSESVIVEMAKRVERQGSPGKVNVVV